MSNHHDHVGGAMCKQAVGQYFVAPTTPLAEFSIGNFDAGSFIVLNSIIERHDYKMTIFNCHKLANKHQFQGTRSGHRIA